MSCYYGVMQPCKEFYKSPLSNVGTLPGQDFSHSTPEFPGAEAAPTPSCSGTFGIAALSSTALRPAG